VNANLLLGDFQLDMHGMAGFRQVKIDRPVQRFAQLVHVMARLRSTRERLGGGS
jgi:hypothetical protein